MTPAGRCLLLLATWPVTIEAQSPASLTGTVRDSTGRPVRDAVVVVDFETAALRTRTDSTGSFRFAAVAVGRHEIQFARLGFRPHRATIDVPSTGLDVTIVLEPIAIPLDTVAVRVSRPGVYGTVSTRGMSLLPHEPRPLRGAIIEVLDSPHRTSTTADGRFSLSAVGEGAWSLLVRLDRYQSRVVGAYVPPDGGVELNIVLDSTIADWQRREDNELREISRRIREANNPSAFVSAAELVGPAGMTLATALRNAPSTLSRGLLVKDEITCVYIDGVPRPRMTANDIDAGDVHAVEVYGLDGRGGFQQPSHQWPSGTFCGTGFKQGPGWRPPAGEGPRGYSAPAREADNLARVLVVWMKKGRG